MFVDIRFGVLAGIEDRFAVGTSPVYELNHQKSWVALQQGSGQQCVELGLLAVRTWAAMKIKGGQHCCPCKKKVGSNAKTLRGEVKSLSYWLVVKLARAI